MHIHTHTNLHGKNARTSIIIIYCLCRGVCCALAVVGPLIVAAAAAGSAYKCPHHKTIANGPANNSGTKTMDQTSAAPPAATTPTTLYAKIRAHGIPQRALACPDKESVNRLGARSQTKARCCTRHFINSPRSSVYIYGLAKHACRTHSPNKRENRVRSLRRQHDCKRHRARTRGHASTLQISWRTHARAAHDLHVAHVAGSILNKILYLNARVPAQALDTNTYTRNCRRMSACVPATPRRCKCFFKF